MPFFQFLISCCCFVVLLLFCFLFLLLLFFGGCLFCFCLFVCGFFCFWSQSLLSCLRPSPNCPCLCFSLHCQAFVSFFVVISVFMSPLPFLWLILHCVIVSVDIVLSWSLSALLCDGTVWSVLSLHS